MPHHRSLVSEIHCKFTCFYFTFKMSSWLSNNLTGGLSSISNFTGQISSFTREMLTEGTEEVSGKICVFWFSWQSRVIYVFFSCILFM